MACSGWQLALQIDFTQRTCWRALRVWMMTICLVILSTDALAESSSSSGLVEASQSTETSVAELERKRKRLVAWEGVTISGMVLGGAATVAGTGLMIHGLTYQCPDGPRGCGLAGLYRTILGGIIAGAGVPVTGISIAGYVTSHRRKQEVKEQIRKRQTSRLGTVQVNVSIVPSPTGIYGGVNLRF